MACYQVKGIAIDHNGQIQLASLGHHGSQHLEGAGLSAKALYVDAFAQKKLIPDTQCDSDTQR